MTRSPATNDPVSDRRDIRQLLENRTIWHDDGVTMAIWFQGTADEVVRVSRAGWHSVVSMLHVPSGAAIAGSGLSS
jgi:hypothetical protein